MPDESDPNRRTTPAKCAEGKVPATIVEFQQCLAASGLVSVEDCKAFVEGLFPPGPADPKSLAMELVRAGKLTKFQANAVYNGRIKQLSYGEYIVHDKLGQGGMGQVLKAEHRRMRRMVALKVISSAAMKNPDSVRRFQREVHAAARLIHPNIVTAFDANEASGVHFLVMEYVEGQDLSIVVRDRGRLPLDEAIRCTLQAARGLAYAHENGIIHRDIKPANLLVDKKGNVKILDMGLARIELGGEAGQELTSTGQVMGTIDYMAPEQALDTRTADARADIYSLGCTLYRLLTGENMYAGDTIMKKIFAHRESPIPSLQSSDLLTSGSFASVSSASGGHQPPDGFIAQLDAIFQKMVAKDPQDRFQTMAEVVDALEGLSRGGRDSFSSTSSPSQSDAVKKTPDAKLSSFLAGLSGPHKGPAEAAPATLSNTSTKAQPPPEGEETLASVHSQEQTSDRIAAGVAAAYPSRLVGTVRGKANPKRLLYAFVGAGAIVVCLVAAVAVSFVGGDPPARKNKQASAPKPLEKAKATASLSPTSQAPHKGFALDFDGKASRVELPTLTIDEKQPFTVELWVSVRGTGPQQRLVTLFGNGNMSITGGNQWKATGHLGVTSHGKAKPPSDSSNQLTHAAAVWDGSVLRLFVNGSEARQEYGGAGRRKTGMSLLGSPEGDVANPGRVQVLDGQLDELRISKVARYTENFTPRPRFDADQNTIALYHFDEGQGDVLNDSSGNKHHGKISGAKWVAGIAGGPTMTAASTSKQNAELSFDGAAYVELPKFEFDLTKPLTVEAWAIPEQQPPMAFSLFATTDFVRIRVSHERKWRLSVPTAPSAQFPQNYRLFEEHKPHAVDRPIHVAAMWSGRRVLLFVNGQPQQSDVCDVMHASPMEFALGGTPATVVNRGGYHGTIGQIRISTVARYAHTRPFTPEPQFPLDTDTLALYRCDDGQGDVLKDSSGNGYHGKIVGAKWARRVQN